MTWSKITSEVEVLATRQLRRTSLPVALRVPYQCRLHRWGFLIIAQPIGSPGQSELVKSMTIKCSTSSPTNQLASCFKSQESGPALKSELVSY